jgi:hypothetical protein
MISTSLIIILLLNKIAGKPQQQDKDIQLTKSQTQKAATTTRRKRTTGKPIVREIS